VASTKKRLGSLAWITIAGLQAPGAWSQSITQSATFNPVLQVDAGSGYTGLDFTGISSPISGARTTINLTKCDDPISSTGVCVGPRNSYNDEIRLRLRSPSGTIVPLVNSGTLSGQRPGNTVTWTFSDAASAALSGSSLISGTYLPASSLSAFSGEGGNGTWDLLFEDTGDGDPLSINSWLLELLLAAGVTSTPLPNAQPYADIQSVSIDALKNQRELVLAQAGECNQNGWMIYDSQKAKGKTKPKKHQSLCVFGEGGYAQGDINGTSTIGGYSTSNATTAYGIEWKASKKWAVGAAYGYGTANLGNYNFRDTSAYINSDVNSGNIYGVYRPSKNWKISALAGYSKFNSNGARTYLDDTANSTFSSNGYTGAIEASYGIFLGTDLNNKKNKSYPVRIKPLVGVAWGGNQQSAISETGSGTLLNLQEQMSNSLVATFGASLDAAIPLNKKKTTVLKPRFGIAYQYDFLANQDGNKQITASLQSSPSTSYTEVGQNRGINNIYLNLGGDLEVSPRTALYANVNYQAFSYGNQIGYQGGIRIKL
jgi:hypothetical protein